MSLWAEYRSSLEEEESLWAEYRSSLGGEESLWAEYRSSLGKRGVSLAELPVLLLGKNRSLFGQSYPLP